MEIINIVISVLTLVITVFVSFTIYFLEIQNKKSLRKKEVKENAKKFIRDNEIEIDYLELATVAAGCFPNENHAREIYNNFTDLDDETKEEVLKQRKLKCKLIANIDWLYTKISNIREAIEKLDIGNDFLYEDGKNLTCAFFYKKDLILENFFSKKYKNIFNVRGSGIRNNGKLAYFEYLNDYLYCKYNKPNLMPKGNELIKPNDYLICEEDLGKCDAKKLSYWMMIMVSEVMLHSTVYLKWKFFIDRKLDCVIETFEDKYFSVLFSLYYLKKRWDSHNKQKFSA